MEQWKIHRERAKCTRPGCPLPSATEYFAVLELPSCVRRELCAPCFRELEAESEQAPVFWKMRRREKRAPTLDLGSMRRLFDRLGEEEDDDERRRAASDLRYLVALILLRKRVLKLVDAETPEQESADLVVVDPKREDMEPVALHGPDMTSERLAALKEELAAALSWSALAGAPPEDGRR